MANGSGDEDDAPPAVPQWQPSELARRIAAGHAGSAHFIDISGDELAAMIQARVGLSVASASALIKELQALIGKIDEKSGYRYSQPVSEHQEIHTST